MEPDDLVVGELYLIKDYAADRCSPHFKRLFCLLYTSDAADE